MIKSIRTFFSEIIKYDHLQSLGVATLVFLSSSFIFDHHATLPLLFVTYLTFESIYLYDRSRGLKGDRVYILVSFLITDFLIIIMDSNLATLAFVSLLFFFGVLYTHFVKNLTKKIFLLKDVYISSVFSVVLVLPLVYYSLGGVNLLILLFLSLFVFVEAMFAQITLDNKDLESDKKVGLKTLPVLLGREKSIKFLSRLSILTFFVFLFASIFLELHFLFAVLVGYSFTLSQISFRMIADFQKQGFLISASKFLFWLPVVILIIISL